MMMKGHALLDNGSKFRFHEKAGTIENVISIRKASGNYEAVMWSTGKEFKCFRI
jgi:hypothetical protein